MQEMTTAICATATTPNANATTYTTSYTTDKTKVPQVTLKDTRDNNSYIIRKLADGHCWMVSDYKTSPTAINGSMYYYNYQQAYALQTGNLIVPKYQYIADLKSIYTSAQTGGFPLTFSLSGGYYRVNSSIYQTTEAAYYWKDGSENPETQTNQEPCFTVNFYKDGAIDHEKTGCGCQHTSPCYFSLRYMVV